jgi:hypothetical protein
VDPLLKKRIESGSVVMPQGGIQKGGKMKNRARSPVSCHERRGFVFVGQTRCFLLHCPAEFDTEVLLIDLSGFRNQKNGEGQL